MKPLIKILIAMILILASCQSKQESKGNEIAENGKALIHFPELTHDFGKISEGEKVACLFKFENRGVSNLIINSVTTSCGCTVPRFSEEPVPPGKGGTIEVVFDSSHREGQQTKTITVRSNAETPVMILRINAEIITN